MYPPKLFNKIKQKILSRFIPSDSHGDYSSYSKKFRWTSRGAVEPWGIFLIVLGFILSILVFGYYSQNVSDIQSNQTVQKNCGITVVNPKPNSEFKNGDLIQGYAHGCGWNIKNGTFGSVTLFRYDNIPVGVPMLLVPVNSSDDTVPDTFNAAYLFSSENGMTPGYLKFVSTMGQDYIVPVTF